MQTTRLDNKEISEKFGNLKAIGNLVEALEEDFWNRGLVVCTVHVNGMNYLDHEKELCDKSIAEISQLEIGAQKPESLIGDSIESINTWIPQIVSTCESASASFIGGEFKLGKAQFSEILDGCQSLTDAFRVLKGILIELNLDTDFSQKWTQVEGAYSATIRELLRSFEASDWFLIGDILKYDLPECLTDWGVLLQQSGRSTIKTA